MNPAATLYRELVLDHHRSPRRRGALEAPTHAADGVNPLCGDALHVELRCSGASVADFAFSGETCAIATAAASMLGAAAIDRDRAALDDLRERFEQVVGGHIDSDPTLGDLNAFAGLARYPSRRKCALLAFATLLAALDGNARTSTEI